MRVWIETGIEFGSGKSAKVTLRVRVWIETAYNRSVPFL